MGKFTEAALIIIDVQKAIDAGYHAAYGPRNNVDAEGKIARLLAKWRADRRAIVHVRHDSTFRESAYRPGQDGNNFKDEVMPLPDEAIIPKTTNSAFIGTPLETQLRTAHIHKLIVTGVSTNNSVSLQTPVSPSHDPIITDDSVQLTKFMQCLSRTWTANTVPWSRQTPFYATE
jgi:nicotinamidase-related amidase